VYRKPGQGGDADHQVRDLRAELLQAEAAHFAKVRGGPVPAEPEPATNTTKRQLENGEDEEEEDPEAKRRRILEETRDIDADSDDAGEDDSSEDDRFVRWNAASELNADLGQ
jgi:protein CWC15